jgi:hypothetical protein
VEVERDGVESVIGGPDDGPDGALDVADVGAERTGALLGVRIRRGRRTSACRLVMRMETVQAVGQPLRLVMRTGAVGAPPGSRWGRGGDQGRERDGR